MLNLMLGMVVRACDPVSGIESSKVLNYNNQSRSKESQLFISDINSSLRNDARQISKMLSASTSIASEKVDISLVDSSSNIARFINEIKVHYNAVMSMKVSEEKFNESKVDNGTDDNLDESNDDAPSMGLQLVLDILQRCNYFFTIPDINQQVIIM